MKNGQTVLYVVIGILIGVILMLVISNFPPKIVIAGSKTDAMGGTADDMIAVASQTRSDTNILWVLNAKTKTLVLYDYSNEDNIRFKAARDIQYDVDLPPGVAYSLKGKAQSPTEVRDEMKKLKKAIEDAEKAAKEAEKKGS
jgi:hypothetical protein